MSKEEKPGDDVPPDNHRVKIKSIGEALGFLFRGLHEANQQFIEGEDAGRRGVIAAVSTAIEFLSFFESTTDHRQPFAHLLNALANLDEGNVLPLLKPVRRSGRPRASLLRASCKGLVAATVHRLLGTGLGRTEAHKIVAKACREAGIEPGRKGAKNSQGQKPEFTGRTVSGWCKEVAADVGCRSQAAQTFDISMQRFQGIEGVDAETARSFLVEGLRKSLARLLAPES